MTTTGEVLEGLAALTEMETKAKEMKIPLVLYAKRTNGSPPFHGYDSPYAALGTIDNDEMVFVYELKAIRKMRKCYEVRITEEVSE